MEAVVRSASYLQVRDTAVRINHYLQPDLEPGKLASVPDPNGFVRVSRFADTSLWETRIADGTS
jgi:hypothetical protein